MALGCEFSELRQQLQYAVRRFVEDDGNRTLGYLFERRLAAFLVRKESEEKEFIGRESRDGKRGGECGWAGNRFNGIRFLSCFAQGFAGLAHGLYKPCARIRNAGRTRIGDECYMLPRFEPREYFVRLFYFRRRVEAENRLLEPVVRKKLGNDARIFRIDNIRLLEVPKPAQRHVAQIPYRRRDYRQLSTR